MMKKLLFVSMLLLGMLVMLPNSVLAQAPSSAVKVQVKDGTTNDVLPGASVWVKGTTVGAATDLKGNVPTMRLSWFRSCGFFGRWANGDRPER